MSWVCSKMRCSSALQSSEVVIRLIFLSLLSLVDNNSVLAMSANMALAPALYVFGDSLFDSGNNNFLPTIAKADFLPYGVNFARGVTGRFTNGRTIVDFIGTYIYMHIYYLSTSPSVCFASTTTVSYLCYMYV